MKGNKLKIFGAGLLVSAAFSFASFAAAPINNVNFTYTIVGENAISSGYNDPAVEIDSSAPYEVSDFSCASDTSAATGKSALTYNLTLSSKYGYYFASSSSVSVTGNGITEVTKSTTSSSDNSTFTIKFKAYPYYQLNAPEFVTSFDEIKGSKSNSETTGRATTLNISKNGASKVEYVIAYVDQDGEYKTKSGTTTGSYITVSTYNKRYTGSSDSKNSCYIRGIAIRAAGSLGSNPYVVPSEWVFISGGSSSIDTEEYFDNYSVWDDFSAAAGASSAASYSNNNSSSSGSSVNIFGWAGSGDTWYYYSNGNKVYGWVFDGSDWYYCDTTTGAMKSGWIQDGGLWYFLNTNHDGTFGRMLTGWISWNGSTYYLKPNSGGPMGSMVTGANTINGRTYYFSESGALIG